MTAPAASSEAFFIRAAVPANLAAIAQLLEYAKLPSADICESLLRYFQVAHDDNGVLGAVGLEIYERVALLRSLVVSHECRGRGVGAKLTVEALSLARNAGCRSVYLLTTTASAFFEAHGFHAIGRDDAPEAIRSTTQFSALCPSTAVLMVKHE